MKKEIILSAAQQAEGVMTEAYKDVLSPSLQPIGQILSYIPRAIRVAAFSKVEKWIIEGEDNIKATSKLINDKLKDVPADQLTDIEPHIAIPAIQQLSYSQSNEVLRELYANLIASSMIRDKKQWVHPAFIDIIKQLTPDEAKFLSSLSIETAYKLYPLARVWGYRANEGFVIASYFSTIGINQMDYVFEIATYLENLDRLKIININDSQINGLPGAEEMRVDVQHIYENSDVVKSFDRFDVSVLRSFTISNFGLNFIKTCCS